MPEEHEAAPRVSVTVPAPPAEAFWVYAERQIEWQPPGHLTVKDPESVTLEPWVGGRYYERGADGTEIVRGTVAEWDPPRRLAVTWRIGPGWRPAPELRAAIANPGPGGAVERYAETVKRHAAAR
jgi:uncharacterized protein YndB with AHSA1/START domain